VCVCVCGGGGVYVQLEVPAAWGVFPRLPHDASIPGLCLPLPVLGFLPSSLP
jgi:hypothetical protein